MAEVQLAGGPREPLSLVESNGNIEGLASQCIINNTMYSLLFRERVSDLAKQPSPDLSDVRFALDFAKIDQKVWGRIIDIAKFFCEGKAQPDHEEGKALLQTRDRLIEALERSLKEKDAKFAEAALAAS